MIDENGGRVRVEAERLDTSPGFVRRQAAASS
jgi:hypothetical protein